MSGGAYITLYVVVPFLIYAAALTGTLVALKKNKLTDNGADWLVSPDDVYSVGSTCI